MGAKQRHISPPERLELHQIGTSCFICRFLQKQHKICSFLACCLHVIDRLLYKNKNADDDRKSENLFIFKLNLQTILLTRKLKNYRVFNLLVYFLK